MNKKAIITYVFIDATNIIYGASRYGWKVDFKKLIKYLRERYEAQKVLYYSGIDTQNKKQLGFYKKIKGFGYVLKLVTVKKFSDGSKKADVDSLMTFELMKHFLKYDRVVVMTGDGDFYWVLRHLIRSGKKLKLIAVSSRTARELKQLVESNFIPLSNLRSRIEFLIKK